MIILKLQIWTLIQTQSVVWLLTEVLGGYQCRKTLPSCRGGSHCKDVTQVTRAYKTFEQAASKRMLFTALLCISFKWQLWCL